MPNRVTRGTGLLAHQVEQFDTVTEADQVFERLRNLRGPDAERDKRAATFAAVDRSTLAPEFAKQIDDWLITYDRLNAARERVRDGDLSAMETLVMWAEDLGRSTERLWWRYGRVDGLKKSAEELGLGKLESEKSLPKAIEARKEQAKQNPPEWWEDALDRAREIRVKHPSWSRNRVADHICSELERSKRQVAKVIESAWP